MNGSRYLARRADNADVLDLLASENDSSSTINRTNPDVITPGEDGASDDLRDALRLTLDRLRVDLDLVGGPSTETGQGIERVRAKIVEFYGRALGERPPYLSVDKATSSLPEGSEEVAANERLGLEDESIGYRP